MNSILIIAAHPDDEVLGCGGTIAKLSNEGATINVAFLADGVTSRENNIDHMAELALRKSAARNACNILGVKEVFFGDFPDNRMDTIALLDLVKSVEDLINHLGFQNQRIAIEINESIIPKSDHSLYLLKDQDEVEVINAVGGG